jgi:hypothetical protein
MHAYQSQGCFISLLCFEFGFPQFANEYFLSMKYDTLESHHWDKSPKNEKTIAPFSMI